MTEAVVSAERVIIDKVITREEYIAPSDTNLVLGLIASCRKAPE